MYLRMLQMNISIYNTVYNTVDTAGARAGALSTIRDSQRDLRDTRSHARADGVTLAADPLENWNL